MEEPAQYQTITSRVNMGCDGSGVENSGCTRIVEIPAKYGTYTHKRLKTPATFREETVPAEYREFQLLKLKPGAKTYDDILHAETATVTTRVVNEPATYTDEAVPAETKTFTVEVVKTQATYREEAEPAEFATVTKRRLVKAGGFSDWREVVCGEKLTGYSIQQIQEALKSRGYDPGPLNNTMTDRTKKALLQFQKDQDLPQGGLDFETLKALGINI